MVFGVDVVKPLNQLDVAVNVILALAENIFDIQVDKIGY
jgi:hypothetical protein